MVPVQARRIKQVNVPEYGSRVECPRNTNRLKNTTCGMMTCEMSNLEKRVKFVFSPGAILCSCLGSNDNDDNQ